MSDTSKQTSHNLDEATVQGFGREWSQFDQSQLPDDDHAAIFEDYFKLFPWQELPASAVGADLGCGSGRWAKGVAPRVGHLHLLDASELALGVAKQALAGAKNVSFHLSSIDQLPFDDASLDFAYSLGVLHHVPDTAAAIRAIAQKLKPGGLFLVYLYYAFDNRPRWFRALWRCSDVLRRVMSRMPFPLRYGLSQMIAALVYWPWSRAAQYAEARGIAVSGWPLSYYRDKSFYVMRTDALDRFGTRLEQRFSRAEIEAMLSAAGLVDVRFSDTLPYWCALARRRAG